MHYYLCPRCKFRVAINKHVCPTCGYSFPSSKSGKDGGESETKSAKGGFFSKLFHSSESAEQKESAKENPALG